MRMRHRPAGSRVHTLFDFIGSACIGAGFWNLLFAYSGIAPRVDAGWTLTAIGLGTMILWAVIGICFKLDDSE